ncbi:MAG: ribulose-phosphate 3-epimerase [Eggerthellaceae bacterium]|nr:ribulose-phosphate 3-epimerase [Eggerthellaceae bacterium]
MDKIIKIAPSLHAANSLDYAKSVKMAEEGGADYLHIDVMDGHFVPNLSFGISLVSDLKAATGIPLDIHLLVSNPVDQVEAFAKVLKKSYRTGAKRGKDIICFHVEPFVANANPYAESWKEPKTDEERTIVDWSNADWWAASRKISFLLKQIRFAGIIPAIGFKPHTPLVILEYIVSELDMILCMTVEPGLSGQSTLPGMKRRVNHIVDIASKHQSKLLIEVDGGMNKANVNEFAQSGVNVFVFGSGVYHAEDPTKAIKDFGKLASK